MIKAGYAEADITPEHGEDLCGFTLRSGPVTAIHDRLKTRWLSISDSNKNMVAIGNADIISLSRGRFQSLERTLRSNSPKPASIALATTHTHSGPATVPLRYCGRMDRNYMAKLETRLADAAMRSLSGSLKNVSVSIGSTQCDWAINRRSEAGLVDHELITLTLHNQTSGRPVANIVNYACHPVILGHESNAVSADYPGVLAELVEENTGAPCLFLNGACGDLNPRNAHQVNYSEVKKAGKTIGTAALKAIAGAKPVSADSIAYHTRTVKLPVHQPRSPAEFERRLDMLEERFGISRHLFADRVSRNIRFLGEGRYPRTVSLKLGLLALGSEVAILFVPGELFSSIGLQLKAIAQPRQLLISGFSNGSVGYLPDRQAFKDGGYEPYFANFFYDFPEFEPSVAEVLMEGASALIKSVNHH